MSNARRKALLILCILCLVPFTGFTQQPNNAPETKPSAKKPDYSQEAFVIEQSITKTVFENDGTSTREAGTKVRIQSDAGVQRFGVLTFPYQSATESLEIDYVRLQKPDGTLLPTPTDTAQDMPTEITRRAPFYSDLREKQVAVKGLSVGDVLDFHAHWRTTKPLAVGQFWYTYNFANDSILLQEQLQISVPSERAIKWKSPSVKPVITEEGARRIFTWTNSQVEHKSSEQEKKNQEEYTYEAARGKLPAPDVQISTFQSWDEVGNWYNSLQQERVKPDDEVRAKAAYLVKTSTDDNAKMRAIYHYVSTQFRYVGVAFGIGRYQPHAAAEVLSNQYGDCKDKHTLLASLLDAAGIEAYPALINMYRELDSDVPSPAQFDHVITAVPHGNSFVWLDATAEVAPFGYLLGVLRDKPALVIPPGKPSSLITTAADPPAKAVQTFKIDAKLKDDGTLEGKIDRSVTEDDAELLLRGAFRSVPLPQWKDLVQQISYDSGFVGDVTGVTASSPEETDYPFHFSYNYSLKDYPQWSERRIISPLPPMLTPPPDTKPSHPILLGAIGEYKYESRVELPKGYSAQLPTNVDLQEDFAEYRASYSIKEGVLRAERILTVHLREVPVSEYEAYKKFAKGASDDHEQYVPLTSRLAVTSSGENALLLLPDSKNQEAIRAEERARTAIIRRDQGSGIDFLKEAVRADDKFLRAWIELGEVQISWGSVDEGMNTLRKAISLDPTQPLPRKMLAKTLMQLQSYDDAVSVWQALIEVAPDEDAFAGLGLALFKLKLFEESAWAFELASERDPESSDLQVRLGSAYLHGGDEEKGIAALRRAIQLNSGAKILNDVAFELADTGEKLPEALEYARKAVREEEEASQDVHLDELQIVDLTRTQRLGTYWATLGWVYFRLGNLDHAEKYLRAAWVLTQDPVIGDRLGQLYERKNEPGAAIKAYTLALGASSNTVGGHPTMQETRERLERLKGEAQSSKAGGSDEDLGSMRTVHLGRIVPDSASAEFFLIFSAGPKVEDVKFISGSEKLKSAALVLTSTKFDVPFPDDISTRIVRRGVLTCFPVTGCSFVLYNPVDVGSLN
jgi:tetratricopeptide (TPR) repeat protein